MKNCETYQKEIDVIFNEIVEKDYDKYFKICQDSENILKKHGFPRVVIHPFGSVITSTALKGSDIDIFVEPSKTFNHLKRNLTN